MQGLEQPREGSEPTLDQHRAHARSNPSRDVRGVARLRNRLGGALYSTLTRHRAHARSRSSREVMGVDRFCTVSREARLAV